MYLCVDTTTSESGVTLVDGRSAIHLPLDLNHASEKLLETIDSAIKKSGKKLSDIEGIFVIKGPGSFTGLRIGIAVANQFAHQLKVPITGLKTDEWWSHRTDEKGFVYLQTMNKAEIYAVPFGKTKNKIATLCHPEELEGSAKWLGELSDEHQKKLPAGFKEVSDILSTEETWKRTVQSNYKLQSTIYNLIEPYYGKEPTITKSKKKLSI